MKKMMVLAALLLNLPALAAEDSYDTRGAVADGLYYSVGADVSPHGRRIPATCKKSASASNGMPT